MAEENEMNGSEGDPEERKPKRKRKWKICPRCEGEGTIVNPSCSVWTEEDRAADPDGFEAMMAGAYDVPCTRCSGAGKVEATQAEEREWGVQVQDARTQAMESGYYGDGQLYI